MRPDPEPASGPVPSAVATAEAVRSGRLTSVAAVEHSLARIAALDPAVGAFQTVLAKQALADAAEIDKRLLASQGGMPSPLTGVPVAVKDNVPVAGVAVRNGSAASDPAPQTIDHPVVRRLRAAGAVIVGTTRVPELCTFGATDSVYGITRNPWDLQLSPGGSSGGSAAAVASGMVAIAHGNDGMGSIRIPAACCGLVGVKPGRGVVPSELGANSWFGMAENGALATTVADAALLLSVLADRPDLAGLAEPDVGIRIALTTNPPIPGTPVDTEFAEAVVGLKPVLAGPGYSVTETVLRYPVSAGPAALVRWFAGTAADAELLPDRALIEPRNRRHAGIGDIARRLGLPRESASARWRRAITDFFRSFDVLITPALAGLPLPAQRWGERGWARNSWANIRYAPFAATWNLMGWPAVVVPVGVHSRGVPIAVQLVAPPGGEPVLLGLAAQLERLVGWRRLAPAFASAG